MSLLSNINSPQDLKKLTVSELESYAEEVRQLIISTINTRGGHLASNLGTVELTIALHYVFDCPEDKFVFDTGHQAYAHKIITGRRNDFANLRSDDGISGFEKKAESEFDAYTGGHSGNSLSIGMGLLRANKLQGKSGHVVSIIGDGALTAGMAYEALNDIGASGENLIIILNDNKMSISKNVGAMSKYLTRLRMSSRYSDFKENIKKLCLAMPFAGDKLVDIVDNAKDSLKNLFVQSSIFESMGIKYYGPFDGHNIRNMVSVLQVAKTKKRPVLLHMVTTKGRGYKYAEENPRSFHGVAPKNSFKTHSFSKCFGEKMCEIARQNDRVVAITAAMTDGTGLTSFAEEYPDRFFDVGISEQHAADLAAGLASGGMKPFFAVYSSFLQRAVDQVLIDICVDKLPVVLAIDHAGFVDGDGVTHQGVYDLSLLKSIPNMVIMSPMNSKHLCAMIEFAATVNQPIAIRYPKSYAIDEVQFGEIKIGKWDFVRQNNNETLIIATNSCTLELALKISDVDIVYATFAKPLDEQLLRELDYKKIITIEDNVLSGGLGESIVLYLHTIGKNPKFLNLGYPDKFIERYSKEKFWEECGLSEKNINKFIKAT